MSRRAARAVSVTCDPAGVPVAVSFGRVRLTVCGVADRWREWFDVLDGAPEREVWVVETDGGVCELHGLRPDTAEGQEPGETEPPCRAWLLCRWED